jgi:hypothetical protein
MRWPVFLAIIVFPLFTDAVRATGGADSGAVAPAPAKPAAKAGEWQVTVGAASAEGRRTIAATLRADAPIPGSFGPVTPKLVLRYRGGQPAAYVGFETYVGEGELDAEVTFGEQPAERQKWTIAADGQTAFVAGEAFDFFERLKTVPKLSVRIALPRKNPVTVTFTLRETEAVLKALISAGVKYGG